MKTKPLHAAHHVGELGIVIISPPTASASVYSASKRSLWHSPHGLEFVLLLAEPEVNAFDDDRHNAPRDQSPHVSIVP